MKNIKTFTLLILTLAFSVTPFMMVTAQTVTWEGDDTNDPTNWNVAANWDSGNVPLTTNDVVIPSTTHQPVISSGTLAVAKSVKVETGASFTINSGATLTIKNASQHGLYNQGTVENSGTVNIDKTGGFGRGIQSEGSFTNNGVINIGQHEGDIGQVGIGNGIPTANFENHGEIHIDNTNFGGIVSVGIFTNTNLIHIGQNQFNFFQGQGIENHGSFFNTGGEIKINRTKNYSIDNAPGSSFHNTGKLVLGINSSSVRYGIFNGGNFYNESCGALIETIDRINKYPSSGYFENDGSIIEKSNSLSRIQLNDGLVLNRNGGTFIIDVNNGTLTTYPVKIWIGCINNDWNEPGNWLAGEVPAPSDQADVFPAVNFPVIKNGMHVQISALTVFDGAEFTIDNDGTVEVYGPVYAIGIYNRGNFTNNGHILFGPNLSSHSNNGVINSGSFYNTGEIVVDKILNNSAIEVLDGSFINEGMIKIGQNENIGQFGIDNKAIFNNQGGTILIDRTGQFGIYNRSDATEFLNAGTIKIGLNGGLNNPSIIGLFNLSHFNNDGCQAFLQNNNKIISHDPSKPFTNGGTIIEESGGISKIQINNGIIQSLNGGIVTVTTNNGINTTKVGKLWSGCTNTDWNEPLNWHSLNVPGAGDQAIILSTANQPVIPAGTTVDIRMINVEIDAELKVEAGAVVNVEGPGSTGLNNYGTMTNEGTLNFNQSNSSGNNSGLFNEKFLYNHGTINVFNSDHDGIRTKYLFHNHGTVNIGQNGGNIGKYGLFVMSGFSNYGEVNIDHTNDDALRNYWSGNTKNEGIINIGLNGGIAGANGISNIPFWNSNPVIDNLPCGQIYLHDNIHNEGIVKNQGLLSINTTDPHSHSGHSITNNGIIEFLQPSFIPNLINNEIVIAPIEDCPNIPLPGILDLGNGGSFDIGTTWYTDPGLNVPAGTYDQATNTFSPTIGGGSHTVYLSIDGTPSCPRTVSFQLNLFDLLPPVPQCLNPHIDLDPDGEYTLQESDVFGGGTDNCGTVNFVAMSSSEVNCFNIGTPVSVTVTVNDGNGNQATCASTVTVNDFININQVTVLPETCAGAADGSVTIDATAGGGQLQYSIDGGINFQLSPNFTNLAGGTYDLVLKVFGIPNVCEITSQQEVASGPAPTTWYKDMDGDGYTDGSTLSSCAQPSGYVAAANPGDCDDNDALEFPGQTWYEDLDGDTHGSGNWLSACERPYGCYVSTELTTTSGDCNDNDPNVYPGATEICDGEDNNCNGQVDEGLAETYIGNVLFSTQSQLDEWLGCYDKVQGNVTIMGGNISDLSPLTNITEITGNLTITFNSILTSLNGLDGLATVGGYLLMYYNFQLSDCCAISDLLDAGGVAGAVTIFFNAPGSPCNSAAAIIAACNSSSLAVNPNSGTTVGQSCADCGYTEMVNVFPNPASSTINIKWNGLSTDGTIQLVDLLGRVLLEKNLQPQNQFHVHEFKAGIYSVVIRGGGYKQITKRVMVSR